MAYLLGIDTGGTYTDAVVMDEDCTRVIAQAKALTTRPDLAAGVGRAIDAALAEAGAAPAQVALVSLSTTLATNALVEGQGGRVALISIGFADADLARGGLMAALGGDPLVSCTGGHGHDGSEAAPLDLAGLEAGLRALPPGITGFAVASAFGVRNPAHELAARDLVRAVTGCPVTCSHELSAGLNGPKRALTAVLNARLIGMIDRLITACEAHLARIGIAAPLMVVRGDGALVSTALARERPIETILSGPAASIEGARWLTSETRALVADIGGTTTDVAMLRDGRPEIDPQGARVGPYRTMVEAVAMRTTGLGGDSEVHAGPVAGSLHLGPRRLIPVSLIAADHPAMVHAALDKALSGEAAGDYDGRFVLPMWQGAPPAADGPRDALVIDRLAGGAAPMGTVARNRLEEAAVNRLVGRGFAMIAGLTPSDAAHVLGRLDSWDGQAARKAATLFARRKDARGDRMATGAEPLAQLVIDQLTRQTVDCLLEAAFSEDSRDWQSHAPEALTRHPLLVAGLDGHQGTVRISASLGVPVIGLGASAPSYYGAVGERLGTRMILPEHAGVANAIGAIVGQVRMHAEGLVSSPGPGRFVAHLPDGPKGFGGQAEALAALEAALSETAAAQARAAGVENVRMKVARDMKEAEVEGQPMFVEARLRVTASGRPRIAR